MTFDRRSLSKLSRRRFMIGAAGASALISMPVASAFSKTADFVAFLKASSVLCGMELDRSYVQLGNRIWAAVTQGANQRELKHWQRLIDVLSKLPAETSEKRLHAKLGVMGPGYLEKAQLLARVWYTGRIARKNGANTTTFEVIDYDDALVWRACSFTKPPVTCGGHFGYWQHPYSGTGGA